MKLFLTKVCLLISFGLLNAQVAVGPKAGINISGFSNINFDNTVNIGWHAGAIFDYTLTEKVKFQQDILLSQKGIIIKNTGLGEVREDLYFMEVTFMPKYVITQTAVRPFITAGPYIGLLLFGQTRTSSGAEDASLLKIDENSRSADFGFNFGAGIYLKNYLIIQVSYGLGLKDYERYGIEGGKKSARVASLSFAYLFNL